ncbi:DUF4124 domain-containing protein [Thermomonas fusca]|uniref:DUF4124 domain-containing protein n=1 Tax=Thermomonas fusca TaxID=215690 RepID=A0A5R9PGD9_9GAMM|nr:DUF4124 domain-containing protein [Thermomonas fusca]TLX22604.1 DUF4124 domain-containing protein [Thermomonas fusca]
MRVALALAVCLLLFAGSARAQAKPAATVTVYRCTDAAGKVSLQDAPCAKGQAQQAREMLRPVDASPRAAASLPTPAAPPAATDARTVYLAPPRPLYECVTPEGKRYTSDDGRGNPRWVPLWTLGYPTVRPRSVLGDNIGHPERVMRPPHREINWPVATGGGTWIRDDCVMLPPVEACARLRDRRSTLRTRFFNAQEKERDVLREQERALNARLDNDCDGR